MNQRSGLRKIGEVAELLDATPRTLRFYEEQGLVHPCRSAKGTRLYSETDVARFRAALRLAGLGMPLREIRELTTARSDADDGDDSSRRLTHILRQMIPKVEVRRSQLEGLQRELESLDELIQHCLGCEYQPRNEVCAHCETGNRLLEEELFQLVTGTPPRGE
ncbi:MerR family transcriptional regulator [Endothiovibrio diazotrophicus]